MPNFRIVLAAAYWLRGSLLPAGNKSSDKYRSSSEVKLLLTPKTTHMFMMTIVADTTL
jgi:hypothetical protein